MSKIQILSEIFQGFTNYSFPSEGIEKEARRRASICSECPHANPHRLFKKLLDDNSIEHIKGLGCDKCGCLLSAKVRSPLSKCPEGKWEVEERNDN